MLIKIITLTTSITNKEQTIKRFDNFKDIFFNIKLNNIKNTSNRNKVKIRRHGFSFWFWWKIGIIFLIGCWWWLCQWFEK